MAFVLNDGQGTLFVADKKGNEKRPDREGELNLGGTMYRVSGWLKEGKNGPWLSLKVEPKQMVQARRDPPQKPAEDFPDSIPF